MIKEIATYTGGQPVYTKDLAFLQEAFKEAIICMNKSIGDTYILYGALSGTTVVEGAVVINGDVYKVTALGEIGNNKLCFRKKETSERTFRNSEKHKVYVDYEAYLSTDTSGSVAWIDLKTASRADKRITELEGKVSTLESVNPTEWKNIPVTGEGLDGKVRYKIDKRTDTVILDVQISTYSQYNNDISKSMFDWPSELSEYNNAMTVSVSGGSGGLYNAKSVCLRRGAKGMNVYDDSGPYTIPSNQIISGTFLLSKDEQ